MKREREFYIEDIEEEWTCPITSMPMKNPIVLEDGHSYEQKDITEWLKKKKTSPKTGLAIKKISTIPNITLRNVIQRFETQTKHEISKLQTQNRQLLQRFSQSRQLYSQIQKKQQQLKQLKEKYRDLEQKSIQQNQKYNRLKRQNEKLQLRIESLENQLIGQSIKNDGYEQLRRMNEKLKTEYDNIRSQFQKRQKQKQKQNQLLINLNSTLFNSSQKNQQSKQQSQQSLKYQLTKSNQIITNLHEQNQKLKQIINDKNPSTRKTAQLFMQIQQKKHQINLLNQKIAQLQMIIKDLHATKQTGQQSIRFNQQEIIKATDIRARLESQRQKCIRIENRKNEQIQQYMQQLKQYRSRNTQLRREIQRSDQQIIKIRLEKIISLTKIINNTQTTHLAAKYQLQTKQFNQQQSQLRMAIVIEISSQLRKAMSNCSYCQA